MNIFATKLKMNINKMFDINQLYIKVQFHQRILFVN